MKSVATKPLERNFYMMSFCTFVVIIINIKEMLSCSSLYITTVKKEHMAYQGFTMSYNIAPFLQTRYYVENPL